MCAVVKCLLGLVTVAAGLSGRALAQPSQTPEEIEEITVRGGKTLSQYRLELERAHDEVIRLFNEANEGDDNDVRCRYEAPTGSRIPMRVCFSAAQDRASAGAARDLLSGLLMKRGAETAGAVQNGTNGENRALVQFDDEWRRVLGENPQLFDAVAKYAELEQEFDSMRGVASAYTPQPRQIVLGRAGPQCEASALTEYEQSNNVARVSGTVGISGCPAGTTGSFTLVARVRDEAGAIAPIEFNEKWQRADAQDHVFSSNYPIGDNVFLESVRVRNLKCDCLGGLPQ